VKLKNSQISSTIEKSGESLEADSIKVSIFLCSFFPDLVMFVAEIYSPLASDAQAATTDLISADRSLSGILASSYRATNTLSDLAQIFSI